MLPKIFKPKNEYDLIRLGKNNDGGYLIEKDSLTIAKSLISFGLSYDWSFEKHFYKIKKCPIHCYDPTVKYSGIKKFSRKNIIDLFKIKNMFNKNFLKTIIENIFFKLVFFWKFCFFPFSIIHW